MATSTGGSSFEEHWLSAAETAAAATGARRQARFPKSLGCDAQGRRRRTPPYLAGGPQHVSMVRGSVITASLAVRKNLVCRKNVG
jgi:hypothetical protein